MLLSSHQLPLHSPAMNPSFSVKTYALQNFDDDEAGERDTLYRDSGSDSSSEADEALTVRFFACNIYIHTHTYDHLQDLGSLESSIPFMERGPITSRQYHHCLLALLSCIIYIWLDA